MGVDCLPTAKANLFLFIRQQQQLQHIFAGSGTSSESDSRPFDSTFFFTLSLFRWLPSVLIIHNCVTLNTANGLTQRMVCQHRHTTLSEQFNSYDVQHTERAPFWSWSFVSPIIHIILLCIALAYSFPLFLMCFSFLSFSYIPFFRKDSSIYAHYVFKAFDVNCTGAISFRVNITFF